MIYIYFILGTLCLVLSGMWFGTICNDYYNKIRITALQYFMTILTFSTGLFQFVSMFYHSML